MRQRIKTKVKILHIDRQIDGEIREKRKLTRISFPAALVSTGSIMSFTLPLTVLESKLIFKSKSTCLIK